MTTFLAILLFLVGLVLIIKGGDFFVDAASWMAEISGVPKLIVGATVVSIATTLPELLVSMMASAQGSVGIAVGNAVGSVTANLGLVMALSLIFMPAAIRKKDYTFKFAMLTAAILVLFAFSFGGELKIVGAILLLVMFCASMGENILSALRVAKQDSDAERPAKDKKTVTINIVKFVLGAAGIVFGANLMVDNATTLARLLGISEAVIGATIVAIGTSLPELVTTLTAIAKKESSLSIGNIIGANIIDLTVILPLCAVVSGRNLPMDPQNVRLDMPFCLGLVLLGVIPPMLTGRLKRAQGFVMLGVYIVYIVLMLTLTF